MNVGQRFPRIRLGLLQSERDSPIAFVHAEHLHLDHVADVDHLRRMHRALAPSHLADMNQPLDALFQFDERAVVSNTHDLAAQAGADRIALGRLGPWIQHDLFHAERDALAPMVVLQHDHLDFFADLQHFRRMLQAAPRHVGDMQQAVDSAEIDERAVVRNILDRALEDHALFEHLQRLFLERGALALDHAAPRDHDVAARAVELKNLEAAALADVAIEISRRTQVNVRSRQERRHADIDLQAALDLAQDDAFDWGFVLERLFKFTPDLELLGLGVGQRHRAVLGLSALEKNIDLVAFLDRDIAVVIQELGERHLAFALVVDIDDDVVARDQQNRAGKYIA